MPSQPSQVPQIKLKPKVNNQGPDSVIHLPRAIDLLSKGLSYEEVSKIFNVSRPALIQQVNKYFIDGVELNIYKTYRADILASKQMQILKSLTEEDIQKASPYQKVGMFGILYDKERLERGQSTQNIAYADMNRELKDLDKEILQLESELGSVESK
jgi:transposase